ncbi:MAG TPA: hypothetical protein PLE33_05775 [Candidatus Cloacimonas sp.]|nr:hypothetical protein [Candidatus Cloacimonas sp.]HPS60753.1 hypothetical protein [Candidatus Cloacimonas sp.]
MANIKEYNGTSWSTPATTSYIGKLVESALGCYYFYYSGGHIYAVSWNGTAFGSPVDLFSGAGASFDVIYDSGKFYIIFNVQTGEFTAKTYMRTWDTSTVSAAVQMFEEFSYQYGVTASAIKNAAGGNLYFGVWDRYQYTFISKVMKTSHLCLTSGNIIASIDSFDGFGIISLTLSATQTVPTGCSITYYASIDGGSNWQAITLDTEKVFTTIGSGLMIKAVLAGTAYLEPYIDSWSISCKSARILANTNHRVAQSYISGVNDDMFGVLLDLRKFGTPGNITLKLYSDSGDAPNTELKSTTITAGDISTDQFAWALAGLSTALAETLGTKYWIVISAAGVDASNGYYIRSKRGDIYPAGKLKISTNGGGAYTESVAEDILFKTYLSAISGSQDIDLFFDYVKRFI